MAVPAALFVVSMPRQLGVKSGMQKYRSAHQAEAYTRAGSGAARMHSFSLACFAKSQGLGWDRLPCSQAKTSMYRLGPLRHMSNLLLDSAKGFVPVADAWNPTRSTHAWWTAKASSPNLLALHAILPGDDGCADQDPRAAVGGAGEPVATLQAPPELASAQWPGCMAAGVLVQGVLQHGHTPGQECGHHSLAAPVRCKPGVPSAWPGRFSGSPDL